MLGHSDSLMALIQHGDLIRTMNLRETNYSNKFGVRAFSHIGLKMLNLLPKSIRDIINILDFKKALKTFLMTRGDQYCCWLSRKWSLFLVSSIGYIIYLCDLCEKLLHDWAVVHLLMDYRSSAKTNIYYISHRDLELYVLAYRNISNNVFL